MSKCVIVGGAPISNYDLISKYLRADDFFIFCDSGLNHCDILGVEPDLTVGDFDSHCVPVEDKENLIVLPREKDDSDTIFAVKEGIRRGFDDFLMIGVVGARLDHTLCNVYALLMLASECKKAMILDDYSEMEIILPGQEARVSNMFAYFSLINIAGVAKGVSIAGAKYLLDNAEITCGYQYGISNEVLPGNEAVVTLNEGSLLLIRVFPLSQ